jgi:two-component system sensor histidine kinase UhpB
MRTSTAAGPPLTGTSPGAPARARLPVAAVRSPRRRPRVSLYARVVGVNATVLVAAAALLAFTPATISSPVAVDEALILLGGVLVMVVANAILLRRSLTGVAGLVERMETLDVLQPRQRLPASGGREAQVLIETFNAMLERLEVERRLSTRRTLTALEGERRRIGQELHDEIGQRLTGILLQLGRASSEAPEPLRDRIAAVQDETRATLDEVGALAWQLRPGILDDLGLLSALRALVQTLDEHAEARIGARLPEQLPPLAPEVELAVYRIAQEGLINALRHSGAQEITLTLGAGDDGLSLAIEDDGRGLPEDETEQPGIRGMRERSLLVGGRLRIESGWGRGACVRLDVPAGNLAE